MRHRMMGMLAALGAMAALPAGRQMELRVRPEPKIDFGAGLPKMKNTTIPRRHNTRKGHR